MYWKTDGNWCVQNEVPSPFCTVLISYNAPMSKSPLLSHLSGHKACRNPIIAVVTLQGALPWSSGTWFELTGPCHAPVGEAVKFFLDIAKLLCAGRITHLPTECGVYCQCVSHCDFGPEGLGSDAVWSGRSVATFQAKLLPLSSDSRFLWYVSVLIPKCTVSYLTRPNG